MINFVNGWKQGFFFREATNETFIAMTKSANKMIACSYYCIQLKEQCKEKRTNMKMKIDSCLNINKSIHKSYHLMYFDGNHPQFP